MESKYTKLFLFLGTFMAGYGLFLAGVNHATGDGVRVFGDLVLAAVGAVFVLFIVQDYLHGVHDHNAVVEKLAKKLVDEVDPETKRNFDDLVEVMKELNPEAPPKHSFQLAAIMGAYHAKTGRFVELSFRRDEDGTILGMDSEFSDAESSPEPAGKAAAFKVPVSTDKPLTKSQQRRINDKKGKGPYTDDELKQQANEKRLAAREAKKLAADDSVKITGKDETTLKDRIGA